MSRHKLVKNLNVDDELDDFDGGAGFEDGDEEGGQSSNPGNPSILISLPRVKYRG
jgi:hypothetical protein